jgi:hypothetical protein
MTVLVDPSGIESQQHVMLHSEVKATNVFQWSYDGKTPDLLGVLREALQRASMVDPATGRYLVDPDRIDELIDWALSRDWAPGEGDQIRDEAWRHQ